MPEPPVLLVHGFASSFEREWVQPGWVELLHDAGREVIGVDLLGHGRAAKPHERDAYLDMDDEVLASLPPDTAVDAVGFSLGARVLIRLALASPGSFRRLVLGGVGDNLLRRDDHQPLLKALAGEGTEEGADITVEAFARFARGPGNDPVALAACISTNREPFDTAALATLTLPVLVVLGDRDFAGPGEPLAAALGNAELVTLRGVDHLATPGDFGFIDTTLRFLGAAP